MSSQSRLKFYDCQRMELRALCNEVPRTPPGPEGSNGIGIASGAADHPRFLALADGTIQKPRTARREHEWPIKS
jgi:hypothetical protein